MSESIKIGFAGDICLGGIFFARVKSGQEIITKEVKNLIKKSDFCLGNLEGPISTSVDDPANSVKSPSGSISYLKSCGFSGFYMANNHVLDDGLSGYARTIKELELNDVSYLGVGRNTSEASQPLILQKDGIKVALLAVAQDDQTAATESKTGIFSIKNFEILKQRIKETRKLARWIIVHYHGGEEYSFYPSPAKRRLLLRIAGIPGVDMVICHHSHSFQGIERINRKTIFYSLGNFIFDYHSHNHFLLTDKSCILFVRFTSEKYSIELVPVDINKQSGQIQSGDQDFLNHIQKLSDFKGYKRKWYADSYRVIFERKPDPNTTPSNSLQDLNTYQLFYHSKFYKRLFSVVKNSNIRPIYFGALLHRLFRRRSISN